MNNYVKLNLQNGATLIEIKAQFRKLSKIYHPDMKGGDAKKFIEIQLAYEELLKGNIGKERPNVNSYQSGEYKTKQPATYRFIIIDKEGDDYIIRYNLKSVYYLKIYGRNLNEVANYNINGEDRQFNFKLSEEDMIKADYKIKVFLYDIDYNSDNQTYEVKRPLKGFKKWTSKYLGIKWK